MRFLRTNWRKAIRENLWPLQTENAGIFRVILAAFGILPMHRARIRLGRSRASKFGQAKSAFPFDGVWGRRNLIPAPCSVRVLSITALCLCFFSGAEPTVTNARP